MIRFESDYAEGAHEKILEQLLLTNYEQTQGYGEDIYCEKAREYIRQLCENDSVDVHFLVGGTQTNLTVIASALRPHQGVISAESGHVSTHESGAIEATGHKIITAKTLDGKISASQIEEIYKQHWNDPNHEHCVQPGMVYISNPTENGTIYSKTELEEISKVCKEFNLLLYLDGARLGYGMVANENDLSIKDISSLCDAFYIGGTKVGALFGEALVISNNNIKKDFRYHIKQRGGMLAKGRLLGIQFVVLFKDGLYFQIAEHAVQLAMKIKNAFLLKGYSFLYDSNTNQQFPILGNEEIGKLSAKFKFHKWEKVDENHTAVRFCTSWATSVEHVNNLIAEINNL